jgi:hypothetical protein
MLSPVPPTLSTPEDRLQAEQALLQLRQKTADVANDFYHGKINRAQFLSLYSHYNEKVIIIERMLARDPNTQAWQPVARPGHTTFLRQHYEARVMAFAVYDQGKFDPITVQGTFPIPTGMVQQILQALYVVQKTRRDLKPVSRKTNNSEWLVVIPGFWTTAIALYSLEPAAYQVKNANNLHQDFERANRQALERGIRVRINWSFRTGRCLSNVPNLNFRRWRRKTDIARKCAERRCVFPHSQWFGRIDRDRLRRFAPIRDSRRALRYRLPVLRICSP